MRILVIGGGFIATPIADRLESEGHELLVFSRTPNVNIKCKQITGDIFDFEEFVRALEWKPQVIVHTAWITTPGVYRDDLSNFKYANFTTNLASYIASTDVEHLIILGTCAEYGHRSEPSTAGLTTLYPTTLYAQQKVTAFNGVRELMLKSQVRLTWARIFFPYGLNQDQKRLVPYLINSLKFGKPVLLNDISSIHDWITTRDVASAISWVINNKTPVEIDVGTSLGFTNLELLKVLEELIDTTNRLPVEQMHEFGLNEMFIAGKSSPLFASGWSPADTLSAGLEWVLES